MPIYKIVDRTPVKTNLPKKGTSKNIWSPFNRGSARSDPNVSDASKESTSRATLSSENKDWNPSSGHVHMLSKTFGNPVNQGMKYQKPARPSHLWSNKTPSHHQAHPTNYNQRVKDPSNDLPNHQIQKHQRPPQRSLSTGRYSESESAIVDRYFNEAHQSVDESEANTPTTEFEDMHLSVQERRRQLEAKLSGKNIPYKEAKVVKKVNPPDYSQSQKGTSRASSVYGAPSVYDRRYKQDKMDNESVGYAPSTTTVSISQRARDLEKRLTHSRKNSISSNSSYSSSKQTEPKHDVPKIPVTEEVKKDNSEQSHGETEHNVGPIHSITSWAISDSAEVGRPIDRIQKWVSDSTQHLDTVGLEYAAGGMSHVPGKEFSSGHVVLVRDKVRNEKSAFRPVTERQPYNPEYNYKTEQTFKINPRTRSPSPVVDEVKVENWVVYHDAPPPSPPPMTRDQRSYVALDSGQLTKPSNRPREFSRESSFNYNANSVYHTHPADDDHDSIRDEGRQFMHSSTNYHPSLSSKIERARQNSFLNNAVPTSLYQQPRETNLSYGSRSRTLSMSSNNPFATADDALSYLRQRRESESSMIAPTLEAYRQRRASGGSQLGRDDDDSGLKIERGKLLISNSIDMTSGPMTVDLVENESDELENPVVLDNTNLFQRNYRISRENPMYIGENDTDDQLGRNRPSI